MATYEIKNYIKLLCIRVDHFESFIVNEVNCNTLEEIQEFTDKYKGREGLKVIMIDMNAKEVITFKDVQKFIHNAHVFDYIRHLANEGHKMISADDFGKLDLNIYLQYMLCNNM